LAAVDLAGALRRAAGRWDFGDVAGIRLLIRRPPTHPSRVPEPVAAEPSVPSTDARSTERADVRFEDPAEIHDLEALLASAVQNA
jgi:hypothetical protein